MKSSRPSRRLVGALVAAGVGVGVSLVGASATASTEPADDSPAGSAAAPACARLDEPVTLTWGTRGGATASAHIHVAEQLGYFEEEGITIEWAEIASPSDALPLLAGGQLDIAQTGLTVGVLNAMARGIEVKMLAAQGQYALDAPAPAGFYVRTELIESGEVTEVADLRGRKLGLAGGTNDIGNAGAYLMALVLAEGGLTLKDVEIVNVAVADSPAALASGAIDMTFMPGVVAPIVLEDDTARPFGDPNRLALKFQGGTVVGPRLYEDEPEVAVAALRAMFRGVERLQGDYREDEEVVEALVATGLVEREDIVGQPYYYFAEDLAISEEGIAEFQQIFLDYGGLIEGEEALPFGTIVDDELRAEAYESYLACYHPERL